MPDAANEIAVARQAACNTFNKTRQVNLRVTGARLYACPLASQRGRGAIPNVVIKRHSQVLVWAIDGEEVAGMVGLERDEVRNLCWRPVRITYQ